VKVKSDTERGFLVQITNHSFKESSQAVKEENYKEQKPRKIRGIKLINGESIIELQNS
jgi:hypothetical protein